MFDHIKCKVVLPNGKRNIEDQTKEFQCFLLFHEIDELGQLWIDESNLCEDEQEQNLSLNTIWTGRLWIDDYYLHFLKGKLQGFETKTSNENDEPIWYPFSPAHQLQYQSAEIDRLKSELDLRTKERDQATRDMTVEGDEVVIRHRHGDSVTVIGRKENRPELYAHLAGRGE